MSGWVDTKLLFFVMLELVKSYASNRLFGCNLWIIYTIVVDIVIAACVTQDGKKIQLADSGRCIAVVRAKRPSPV
jgi:hypothetical protein